MPARPAPAEAERVYRRENWIAPLRAFLFEQLGQPLRWGLTDCHALVLRGLDEMIGAKVSAGLIGAYHDAATGIRLLKRIGGCEAFLRRLGCEPVRGLGFGDIVLYEHLFNRDGWRLPSPAFSMGGDRVIVPTEQGVGIVPLYAVGWAESYWRVPCRRP